MKQITKQDIRQAASDRWWLGLAIANFIVAAVAIIIMAIAIEPRETQVITHYSAFGIANFYRSTWLQLLNYALLETIIVISHTVLSLKLLHMSRRELSLAFLWGTIGLSVVVIIYALSIIKIAALG